MREIGLVSPTEIQRLAIPAIFSSDDVLLVAPTGTGKTEAAMLPILELMIRKMREGIHLPGIEVLYITPLRALNRDIFRRLAKIATSLGISTEIRHGDTPKRDRRRQSVKPPNILITTPETLQAILPGRLMRRHLRNVQWVIIDEIHELVSDKRGVQLSVALERLVEIAAGKFQRIGLSATVGETGEEALFLSGNNSPLKAIRSSYTKGLEIRVESPAPRESDQVMAKKLLLSPGNIRRVKRICELIRQHRSVLVFTNTREHAEALASRIRLIAPELRLGVHHGSLSREVRVEVEKKFNRKELDAIVCTSSLELGIDIGEVEFVVQYMSPRQVVKIIQRVGRSGHSAEATAKGCIIGLSPDDILEGAVIVAHAMSREIEAPRIHSNALDVLSHQIAGIVLDKRVVSIKEILELVSRAYPYRELSEEDLVETVSQLQSEGIVRFDGSSILRGPRLFEYYYENLSMIPDVSRYEVYDFIRRQRIAKLDEDFVGKYGQTGNEIIIRGHAWRILRVDDEKRTVEVEPIEQTPAAIPTWEGEMMPVSFQVAWEVGKLRQEIAEAEEVNGKLREIRERYRIAPSAFQKVVQTIRRQISEGFPVPSNRLVLIEGIKNYVVIHSCFGNYVNETLGRVLGSILSSRFGINIGVRSDPYRIVLFAPFSLKAENVRKEIMNLNPNDVKKVLSESTYRTSLFSWRLWHVARRFGAVRKDTGYSFLKARMMSRILRHNPIGRETLREIEIEKYDVKKLEELVTCIHHGGIKVVVKEGEVCSPLASPILDRITPQDLLRPAIPSRVLVDLTKERLNAKRIRLVCVFRGDWQGIRTIRGLPDRVRCPKCNSSLIAVTYQDDSKLIEILKKKLRKRKVTEEEERIWVKAWKIASLVQDKGKKAIIALAGHGVGLSTAIRIFRRRCKNEDDFYLSILRAERDYARTRMFWDY